MGNMVKVLLLMTLALLVTGCQTGPASRAPVVERGQQQPEESATDSVVGESTTKQSTAQGSNSAVLALLNAARQQRDQQQYVAAAASLERAIRISPREAKLYLELAKVRQQQGNAAQAAQLCKKAIVLADDGGATKYECERLLRASG